MSNAIKPMNLLERHRVTGDAHTHVHQLYLQLYHGDEISKKELIERLELALRELEKISDDVNLQVGHEFGQLVDRFVRLTADAEGDIKNT